MYVCSACIGAQDPYCGWDTAMKKCTSLEESLSMMQWEQTLATCPVSTRAQSSGDATCRRPVDLRSQPALGLPCTSCLSSGDSFSL